jgi:hypothetical protein
MSDDDPKPDDAASAEERARALLLPVSSPTPPPPASEEEVPPVLPGRPEPPRPAARVAESPDEQGVVCWNCGVGNRPDRVFCRNCGVELARVPQPAAVPRPKRNLKPLYLGLGVLAAVIVLGLIAIPVVGFVRDKLARSDRVTPAAAAASVSSPQHPASSAFDGNGNSWWGTGQQGDSKGQTLSAQFANPVDFTGLEIFPGATAKNEQARPAEVDVQFTDAKGERTHEALKLDDYKPKFLRIHIAQLTKLDVVIESAYGAGAGKQVAVREVELFGKSGS